MFDQPAIKKIWNVVRVVKITMGFTFGLYLFTYGPYFYEKFGGNASAQSAILLTSIILALRQGLVALLEVPTGAVGDTIGRVNTVIWSLTCRMFFFLGLSLLAIFVSIPIAFTVAVIASIAFAFAYTFYSGTFTAWCVDSIREADSDIGYEHILSRGYTYEFTFQIFGAIIGIVCYHFGLIYIAFLLAALICLAAATFCRGEMEEVKSIQFLDRKKITASDVISRMGEIIAVGLKICRQSKAITWLIIIFASYMFLLNIVDYLWPVHLKASITGPSQTPYWIGMAVFVLFMNIAGSYSIALMSKHWKRKNGSKTHNKTLRRWFICTCLLSALPIIALGLITLKGVNVFVFFLAAVLAVEYSYGLIAPCYETLMNNYIPEENSGERATIMSWGSVVKSLIILVFAIPAGGGSGAGTMIGWMVPGFILLASAILGNFYIKRHEQMNGGVKIISPKSSVVGNATEPVE